MTTTTPTHHLLGGWVTFTGMGPRTRRSVIDFKMMPHPASWNKIMVSSTYSEALSYICISRGRRLDISVGG